MEKTITVKWKKSAVGRFRYQRETLRGLGFRRLNQVRVLADRPEIRGMVRRVSHLVEVMESPRGDRE